MAQILTDKLTKSVWDGHASSQIMQKDKGPPNALLWILNFWYMYVYSFIITSTPWRLLFDIKCQQLQKIRSWISEIVASKHKRTRLNLPKPQKRGNIGKIPPKTMMIYTEAPNLHEIIKILIPCFRVMKQLDIQSVYLYCIDHKYDSLSQQKLLTYIYSI